MPAVKAPKKPQNKHAKLVTTLANRFMKPAESTDLPLVVVNQLSRTSGKHILVIWDDWQDLSGAERGKIITDAYLAAHPDEQTPVTIPIGVTASEALAMGYLKYEIQTLVRKEDNVTTKQITDAMKTVGGIYMQIGTKVQLRFATQAQAETAYRTLNTMLPSPIWALVRETASGDEQ
jgi:hypothetical protein